MIKPMLLASLLAVAMSTAFAQTAASAPDSAASAPKKHKWVHAPKLHKGATPASNPETSFDKKGGA